MQLIICLIISTIGLYLVIYAASFAGANYEMSHGETFIIWILMAILVKLTIVKN
jgi:hypothetical protein